MLHITPSFFPARHCGGTSYSSYALCNASAGLPDIELKVLTTDSDGPKQRKRIIVNQFPVRMPQGYEVSYCRGLLGADISPSMFWRLWPMIKWADVVHLSAVYSPPTIPTLLICKLQGKPVVWSTRGALQRWEGSTRRTIKRLWEIICDSLCKSDRVLLHTTSEEERNESIARIGRATAIVVPNGIDMSTTESVPRRQQTDQLRLLYLGRLHPIKGIENLLRAMTQTSSDVRLSICGSGNADYRQSLERMSRELGLAPRVVFHGMVEGEEKERQFQRADICVVPSHKEAFCLVVAESLARSIPVIVSTGTPWKNVATAGCGLVVNNDPNSLATAILQSRKMQLAEMGQRGREWMQRDYSWPVIAQKIVAHYSDVVKAREGALDPKGWRQPTGMSQESDATATRTFSKLHNQ